MIGASLCAMLLVGSVVDLKTKLAAFVKFGLGDKAGGVKSAFLDAIEKLFGFFALAGDHSPREKNEFVEFFHKEYRSFPKSIICLLF